MNEQIARDVVLVRAIETADEKREVLSEDDRMYASRSARGGLLLDLAALSGEAWIDLARLDEAESVLGTAVAAARAAHDPARAAAALSLPPAAVAGTGQPVQVVSCGVPFLFVPLTTRSAVDSAVVNRAGLDEMFRAANTNAHGVFVFSAQPGSDRATVYSRMFAPDMGIVEDPATGIASGPLGCYLVRHKVVKADKAEAILSLQGAKMGRPSHVHIAIGVQGGEVASVRVGGEAVLAGEGTLYI